MPDPCKLPGIKLKSLCDCLGVDYDEARYTLARGVLPKVIAKTEPGRGNHRVFDPGQAFFLAICLKLKSAGVDTLFAAQVSDWLRRIPLLKKESVWGHGFALSAGNLTTYDRWYIDVGDARYARLVTDAGPQRSRLDKICWSDMSLGTKCEAVRPAVIFRVDIGLIAGQVLAAAQAQVSTVGPPPRSPQVKKSPCTSVNRRKR